MKATLFFSFSIIFFMSCFNRHFDGHKLNSDSSITRINKILNNPFRDINKFDCNFGNKYLDSVYSSISQNATDITEIKDICVGDNCESYKILADEKTNTIFYFFKGDAGEYGFSNAQYVLRADSFQFIRNYDVSISEWPTDSTSTIWKVEELTYEFHKDSLLCKTKRTFTKELSNFDFTLELAANESVKCDSKTIGEEKIKELKQLLAHKDSEARE